MKDFEQAVSDAEIARMQAEAYNAPSKFSIGDVEAEIQFCQRYLYNAYRQMLDVRPVMPTRWQRFKWWIRGLWNDALQRDSFRFVNFIRATYWTWIGYLDGVRNDCRRVNHEWCGCQRRAQDTEKLEPLRMNSLDLKAAKVQSIKWRTP